MQGSILEVSASPAGDEMDVAALAGATSITVVSPTDFSPTGGSVEIDDITYLYTSVDVVTNVMVLSTGLAANVEAGTRINVSPLVIEKWATVEVQADDDAIFALVPHALWDRIEEGVREPEDQESVIIQQQEGDWVVADIIGSAPTVDGGFTDPATAPIPPDIQAALDSLDTRVSVTETDIENVSETASDAGSLASIANVSITVSDYEPATGDAVGKREGSMWFTRTRARVNFVTNPSFETNTTGWTPTQTTALREASAVVISGSYTMKLTNSGVAGDHSALWDNGGGTARQPAAEGQVFTASVFAAGVSGTNNGVYLQLQFLDSGGTPLASFNSPAIALLVDDYQRLGVTGTAPVSTAYAVLTTISPTGNESSVWRIDGALLELDDIMGRYFDGRSYDGVWTGTVDASVSSLVGGKVVKIFELQDGAWVLREFTDLTLQDIDASQVTHGSMSGERLADYTVDTDKLITVPVTASEALLAGDLVNVYPSAGSPRMRKASAAIGALYEAHGHVLTDVANGAVGFMYTSGYNPFVTGLTPGVQFLSTTAGKCAGVNPTDVGTMIQRVGVAGAATVLNFLYSPPVKII